MASIRSIRKHGQAHVRIAIWRRKREAILERIAPHAAYAAFARSADSAVRAMRRMAAAMVFHAPAHQFVPGERASRCGTDVQLVDAVAGNCADFRCIRAPASGWCEVGDVEHNLMRRYQPLSPDEVESILAQAPDARGAPATA